MQRTCNKCVSYLFYGIRLCQQDDIIVRYYEMHTKNGSLSSLKWESVSVRRASHAHRFEEQQKIGANSCFLFFLVLEKKRKEFAFNADWTLDCHAVRLPNIAMPYFGWDIHNWIIQNKRTYDTISWKKGQTRKSMGWHFSSESHHDVLNRVRRAEIQKD